jgi:hypothetical protein
MGALQQYQEGYDDEPTPQDFGATSPFANVDMGGLGAIVQQTADDLSADYTRSRAGVEARRPQLAQADEELANSYMKGYDENAYDAQSWAQAGIGAATPTLSALESLNRAVAGYSGVKLQQRADYGKRVQQEKEAKQRALQRDQQIDLAVQKAAPEQLIDLYKNNLISRSRLAGAIANRYVNVPGRGLVDKAQLAEGKDGVVVPSFQPVEMLQKMQTETAKELEQDKNFHFNTKEEYQAEYDRRLQQKIQMADQVSGGLFTKQLAGTGAPQPAMTAPQPQVAAPLPEETAINSGFTPENQEFLASQQPVPPPGVAESPMGAPGTLASDAEDGGLAGLENIDAQVAQVAGGAPAPVVPPAVAEPVGLGTPWTKYAMMPNPQAAPKAGTKMFSKPDQEAEIARRQQGEKNAENAYTEIAKQSESTAQWYDTLRQMEEMDLNATGSFANIRNSAGKLLESLGYPNAGLAKDAKNLSSVNNLIMQGIQQRLAVQNGVQAKDDADRERQSFAQITDPKQVFKALVTQAKAKALRTVEQEEFYRAWKADKGSYDGASTAWNKYLIDTPIMTNYGGKPVYMHQWIDGFIKRNEKAFADDGVTPAQAQEIAGDEWRKIPKRAK